MKSIFSLIISAFILLAACTGTHMLPNGERLYTGSKVKLNKNGYIVNKKQLLIDVTGVIKPRPNKTVFGVFRPKLWMYETAGKPKGKNGLRSLLHRLGEAPVLFSTVTPVTTSTYIKNRLENSGYFYSTVTYEVKETKHKAYVVYTALLKDPYVIDSIIFPKGANELETFINQSQPKTILKRGQLYNLNAIKSERERIDEFLKNSGYFYFSPDYLVFHADTSLGNHKINLTLSVKQVAPPKALLRYRINRILINPGFTLASDSTKHTDTLFVDGKYYIETDSSLRPQVVTSSVYFQHNKFYERHDHDLTLRRLMGIGIFKYVDIEFNDELIGDTAYLNLAITLTQLHKLSVRAELLGISKSTNYAGPGLDLSFRNRNIFKGSELFILGVQTGFETQIAKRIPGQASLGSLNISANAKLYFPRFVPAIFQSSSYFVPKTKIELGYEQILHFNYFTLNNTQALFGYNWNESLTKMHELNPLMINYVAVSNTTAKFDSLIKENILLKKNFQQQFIIGSNYSFTLNTQLVKKTGSQIYFKGTAEIAGNALSVFNSLTGGKINPEHPATLFGTPYSQYTRFDIDARYFYTWNSSRQIATRLISGIGIPYDNSRSLPYIKQFFIGGSNSIRAFRARTLGPGSNAPPSADSISFFEQAGDMKLEMNAEYRFGIVSIVKGAVFVDAGNIWLWRNDPLRPNGKFTQNFYKEMAVGTGAGLRFDASFIVVRFDFSIPIRKPWLPEKERWVINQIDILNNTWLRNNLVLNIAIGYPF